MHKRRITLADGRPMIFYTFGDPDPNAATDEGQAGRPPEAGPQPGRESHV